MRTPAFNVNNMSYVVAWRVSEGFAAALAAAYARRQAAARHSGRYGALPRTLLQPSLGRKGSGWQVVCRIQARQGAYQGSARQGSLNRDRHCATNGKQCGVMCMKAMGNVC